MSAVHHSEVFFHGHVQGVGFRFAAREVAKEFEVCGFVENLADGRVHLEVEGPKGEIDRFLEALAERMHGFIRKTERTDGSRAPSFTGFILR